MHKKLGINGNIHLCKLFYTEYKSEYMHKRTEYTGETHAAGADRRFRTAEKDNCEQIIDRDFPAKYNEK